MRFWRRLEQTIPLPASNGTWRCKKTKRSEEKKREDKKAAGAETFRVSQLFRLRPLQFRLPRSRTGKTPCLSARPPGRPDPRIRLEGQQFRS